LKIVDNILKLDSHTKIPGWQKIKPSKCKNIYGSISNHVSTYMLQISNVIYIIYINFFFYNIIKIIKKKLKQIGIDKVIELYKRNFNISDSNLLLEKKQNLNILLEEVEKIMKTKYNISESFNKFLSSFDWFTSILCCLMSDNDKTKEFMQKLCEIELSIFVWSFSYNLSIGNQQEIIYPVIHYTLCNYVELLLDKELPYLSSILKLNDINILNVIYMLLYYYYIYYYIFLTNSISY